MYAMKYITEKQVLLWDHKQTKNIYHSSWFYGLQQRNNRSVSSESQKKTRQGSQLDRCNEEIILKTEIGNKYPSTNTQNHMHHWQLWYNYIPWKDI